ncbi:TPA: Na+/H+ antiporter NhaA [Vibrio cholerae]|uniref:Na(+)/H(+) antiporter NhaA n=7 Tax=Vibrio cholerae TaxID=666 RepID=NHAA_VIBCH|nr:MULTISPECIES: Na+/H+ antiporter NhaA [Vibrio]A5F7R1.1 RecName: Full=Na(+)/H(+) antiporter NhaA; AltName: Full=Sodium/proton antiporter NhaA [Vibrio cholerae O395]C3LMV3.1 RecName: Full=Na(+)/H(+) antiporter NhaA; AltName: Full=Sodium/proton antiporter NhaA [Vibrio cholerae M66-2]O85187.1 RecName: Full=Na(+)/H(+) antiporter NhaA; AltName: Full=Sodium/proton antiporter NhaA [Vibrio cholerae O1 biovar El Tor str. N16961]AEA78644.1 Na+/H+ antiporter NhaA type [Vibrio cholerae LMA3984-4]EAZ72677
MSDMIRDFFKMESAGGILLVIAAAIAMVIANSAMGEGYQAFLHTYVFGMSVSHWINDGLMAVFFLLIGLEVKRELLEGALKSRETAIFPAIAAVGGMLAPALIYVAFNFNDPAAIQGWAIPAATDIAFALGIMALLGKRVPVSLKVFLLALAIIDDLGVVVIIALFYSSDLSTIALTIGFIMTGVLFMLNAKHVTKLSIYLVAGLILWIAVLKSGVHATLAGVVIGFAIPLKGNKGEHSPLKHLEHALHPYVAFAILPVFAFANAGISLQGVSLAGLTSMLPLGVALGLFLGKPLGIFSFSWAAVKLGVAKLPEGINFKHIFAVSVLCGIGFTMSIFISSLAFGQANEAYDTYARLGILMGSTTAALLGYSLLRLSLPLKKA